MYQLRFLLYAVLNVALLITRHMGFAHKRNSLSKSYILFYGLLGIHAFLEGSWGHMHWITYSLISCLFVVTFYEESTQADNKIVLGACYVGVCSLLLVLLVNQPGELLYAKPWLSILLGYALQTITLYLQKKLKDATINISRKDMEDPIMLGFIITIIALGISCFWVSLFNIYFSMLGIVWSSIPCLPSQSSSQADRQKERKQQHQQKQKMTSQLNNMLNQLGNRKREVSSLEQAILQRDRQIQKMKTDNQHLRTRLEYQQSIKLASVADKKLQSMQQQIKELYHQQTQMQQQLQQFNRRINSRQQAFEVLSQ